MAGLIGGFLVLLAAGATFAALLRPLLAMWLIITEYIRGIYARPPRNRQDSPQR